MAKTGVPTGDDKARVLYEEKLFRDSVKESFFMGTKMMGEGAQYAIHVKNDLMKTKGEKIRIGLRMRITGPGVTDDEILEDNEEAITVYTMDCTVHQYRNAVRDKGELDRQRAMYDIKEEHKGALQDWGSEKMDALIFNMLGIGSGSTTDPTKVFYRDGATGAVTSGSAATAKAALTAANSKLNPTMVRAIKAWAKTGGNRAYVPIRPLKIDGKAYWILLCHPWALFDLKEDARYEGYLEEAAERGKDNPIFTGAVAIIDGVIIHEHENCVFGTDGGGAAVTWSKALFFGQQAGCWGWGKRPKVVERDFDYGNEEGTAWGIMAAPKKSTFNSLDYGSVGVWLATSDLR